MGTAMFTSGRFLLMVGEKVNARWKQVAPGTIQVTLSTAKFGIAAVGPPRFRCGPSVRRVERALIPTARRASRSFVCRRWPARSLLGLGASCAAQSQPRVHPDIQVVMYNSAAENDRGEGVYLGARASRGPGGQP